MARSMLGATSVSLDAFSGVEHLIDVFDAHLVKKRTTHNFDIGAFVAIAHAHAGTYRHMFAARQRALIGAHLQSPKHDFRSLIGARISAHTHVCADVDRGGALGLVR